MSFSRSLVRRFCVALLTMGMVTIFATLASSNPVFAQVNAANTGLDAAAQGTGLTTPCKGDAQTCLANVIAKIIQIVLGFVEVIVFLYLLFGGFLWMTATSDKGTTKAKEVIQNAIIGLIIITLSYLGTSFVITQLGNALK